MAIRIDLEAIDESGPLHLEETVLLRRDVLDREEIGSDLKAIALCDAEKGVLAGEYVVSGRFEVAGELVCDRCLEAFPFANDLEFAVRYLPRAATPEEGVEEEEVEDENLDLDFYDERTLLLDDILAEQIQLSVPMKTLCREDCRGLCPECGTNLNQGDCGCRASEPDNRWSELEALRRQLEKNEKH